MIMPSIENLDRAKVFLRQYQDRYQREKSLIHANIERVLKEKGKEKKDVPPPPLGDDPEQIEVCKWYAYDATGLVAFHDDGADLPGESKLVIVTQSSAVASANGMDVKSQFWVIKRN
jgi:hypothetical protein